MTQFCRNFFSEKPHDINACPQCTKAYNEIKKEEEILAEVEGPLYFRTEEEQAGLDCHRQP